MLSTGHGGIIMLQVSHGGISCKAREPRLTNLKTTNDLHYTAIMLNAGHEAHSPVMCEIEISNCRKINLIIAYSFIFVLREEYFENAFA